ncbi:MAG: hypothetical protein ACLU6B_12980 [Lachnospirales bacterium]
MRKLWSIMLVLILAVGLVGCSSSGEESSAAQESSAAAQESSAEESVAVEESSVAEESAAEESQSEAQATAESLIGEDVQALIDAIGEPESTAYQDSCAVADAQDGFWTYDGFTVVTLKTAEGETVQDIQ